MSEQTQQPEMVTYEYGIMSTKYSCQATNKLTAYVAMCVQYDQNAHIIAIYSPESSKNDSWINPMGQISDRLDEIFGGSDSFEKYCDDNYDEINACSKTIKQIV